jgi:hypothetical protein
VVDELAEVGHPRRDVGVACGILRHLVAHGPAELLEALVGRPELGQVAEHAAEAPGAEEVVEHADPYRRGIRAAVL